MDSVTEHIDLMDKVEKLSFSYIDYVLFVIMLLISTLIGLYFGFYKKQTTTDDYLLGGKNMGAFPVAVSLAASYVSAITLLGMPAEIYSYGTQYASSCFIALISSVIVGTVYLPVFYDLQLSTSFEYLSFRFDNNVRRVVSFIGLISFLLSIPIVMYVPALAFNLVSGIKIEYINIVVCFICIFYTTVGGLKAVVWSDTIQFIAMNGAILTILILGIPHEGGLSKIWQAAEDSDRIIFFDFDPSMYKRTTFWSMSLGMGTQWISSMGVNQMCIQRFLSVPSMKEAKKVLYIYCIFITLIKALCLFSGLIMFARYSGCDPFTTGKISKIDQILPYYVMDTTRNIPGLPGLFVAGVFSAALSTMSTLLNTASGIIYKDFMIGCLPKDISDRVGNRILKLLVVIIGCVCMTMVFWVEKLGNILQVIISFSGITGGAVLGIFSLGMLIPRANTKGSIAGAFASLVLVMWIMYGNNAAIARGAIKYPTKPFSVEKCDLALNFTSPNESSPFKENDEDVFFLYRITFMWYSLIGLVTMFIVAIPVSYLTTPPSKDQTKLEYFSPVVRKYLPKYILDNSKNSNTKTSAEYSKVELELLSLTKDEITDKMKC